MLVEKDICEVKRIDSIDEANKLISAGWVLLETGTKVLEDETTFFFLLGKTGLIKFEEEIAEYKNELMEKVIPFKSES